jgi:hypothetical protein
MLTQTKDVDYNWINRFVKNITNSQGPYSPAFRLVPAPFRRVSPPKSLPSGSNLSDEDSCAVGSFAITDNSVCFAPQATSLDCRYNHFQFSHLPYSQFQFFPYRMGHTDHV